MLLSEILATLRADGETYLVDAPAEWSQGRTLFGGLQAALLVAAMRRRVGQDIPLRSLQVTFVGPVAPGTVCIAVRVLREGKSAIHVQAHTVGEDGIGCTAVAVFGRARPSQLGFAPAWPGVDGPPEQGKQNLYIPNVTPEFIRYAEQRFVRGGYPFTGAREPRTQTWVRYPREPAVTESVLIAIADTIPSPAIHTLKKFAIASSMTWTLEFLTQDLGGTPETYWLMDAEATSAGDGYVFQTATLWSADRRAIALSRQSAVVFG